MRLCTAALVLFFAGSVCAAAQPAKKGCDLPNADTSVYGITLGDAASTRRVLTDDYKTISDNSGSDFGWTIFASRDNKQLLMLRHHAGDLQHSFLEFEVKFGRHDKKPLKLSVYEFVSGKGVKLGMKRKAVLAKFGPCFRSTMHDDVEIVRYEIKGEKAASGVLKASNMPQYYAEYEFHNGVLHRFKFGHEPV